MWNLTLNCFHQQLKTKHLWIRFSPFTLNHFLFFFKKEQPQFEEVWIIFYYLAEVFDVKTETTFIIFNQLFASAQKTLNLLTLATLYLHCLPISLSPIKHRHTDGSQGKANSFPHKVSASYLLSAKETLPPDLLQAVS